MEDKEINELLLPRNEFELRAFIKLYSQHTELSVKIAELLNEGLTLQHKTLESVMTSSTKEDLREAGIFLTDKKSELGDELENIHVRIEDREDILMGKLEKKFGPHLEEIKKFNKGMITVQVMLGIIGSLSLINLIITKVLPLMGL